MATTIYSDPKKAQHDTNSREANLGFAKLGPLGPMWLDTTNSLFERSQTMNVRNYYRTWRDVDPKDATILRWGDRVLIQYGNEFNADHYGSELHIKLPKLYRKDLTYTSDDGNPLDATYVSGGKGGLATDYLEWDPFIGEKILGGLSGKLYHKHANEPTRVHNPFELHFKRAICTDNEGTSKRDVYINAVGGLVDNTNAAVDLIIPVWLPWAPDVGCSYDHMMPMHAFGEEFVMEWVLPNLQELIRTNIPIASLNVIDTKPVIFLRNHYVVNEIAQRNASADETLTDTGLHFKTVHVTSERDTEVAANADAVDVSVQITHNRMPTTMTIITAHYKDDLQAAGSTATAADVDADPTKKRTYNDGTEKIGRPNWLATIPINYWWVQDGGERVTPIYTMGAWLNSLINGHANNFASTGTADAAILPWNVSPAVENHGLGHQDYSPMHDPRVYINLPANDAKNPSQTRVIKVMHVTHNSFTALQANTQRDFHLV